MYNDERAIVVRDNNDDEHIIRDIHALTPPRPPSINRPTWEINNVHRSSSLSTTSEGGSSENFTTMSREFNNLVLAGSGSTSQGNNGNGNENDEINYNINNLSRIGEDETHELEDNRLAIVPDNSSPLDPLPSPRHDHLSSTSNHRGGGGGEVSVQRVKKEEVESKINAWQNAKIAKLNNRFKREDAIINGFESEEVQKATTCMKKVERKLEEKRARALEKMQNDIAKARRKAEEKRASAEAKRGTKVARVIEIANLMRAVGKAPLKRSFF